MTEKPRLTYDFYAFLTDAIMKLVAGTDPADLRLQGMDFSHAVETYLYFACVHDPGIIRLYYDPSGRDAVPLLRGSAARLLARGLAAPDTRRQILRRQALADMTGAIRRFVRRPVATEVATTSSVPATAPIVFWARSVRFARFFRPVAFALRQNAAFLAPGRDIELAAAISEWSIPCLPYEVVPRKRLADAGRLLREHARYLIDYAQVAELALTMSRARLVVVPEGNSPEDEIVHRVARKLGMNTACLQQGWSPIVHPGFRNLSYTDMLMWGQGFVDLLQPFNPAQHFSCVGNYQLRAASSSNVSQNGLLFFFQGFDDWLGGRESAEAMLALAERIADWDSGIPIYLRPHPVVPFPPKILARIASRPNLILEPADKVSLAEALAKARISVSTYSTAILESVAASVVPIIFNTTTMPKYWPDVDAANAGLEIRDLDEAEACIRNLLENPSSLDHFLAPMARFSKRFFFASGEAALENVCTRLRLLAGI